jgi:hypothetical protein
MTAHKHFKQLVRARMQKTGESYSAARRQILLQAQTLPADPAARWHFPGNVPATTALRVLLAHAGVHAPHTGKPFSEALLFGIAGGIGIGVFSFVYEAENFASFFLAGRHLWHDDLEYLRRAFLRLGITPTVRESGGTKAATKQLGELLAEGPCVAWVDMAHLPHRAAPASLSGGGYHVITVYRVDDSVGRALIGDLADAPIEIPLADLATARARIVKQKNRLLGVAASDQERELADLVREGLQNCFRGLTGEGGKGSKTNFSLEALGRWAQRMCDAKDKESWEKVFTPGPRLWRGLTSVYDYVEHYGSGGGLCRPLFADFLGEAADALNSAALRGLSERYEELGRDWSALADAALPDDLPAFREAKDLSNRRCELICTGGPTATEELRGVWERLGRLTDGAQERFPLTDADCAALRADLGQRIAGIYEKEQAAHAALGEAVSSL